MPVCAWFVLLCCSLEVGEVLKVCQHAEIQTCGATDSTHTA